MVLANLIPPTPEDRNRKNLTHTQKMFEIIRDRGDFNTLPDPQYDYLKRAEQYQHQALQAAQQGFESLANAPVNFVQTGGGGPKGGGGNSKLANFIQAIAAQESGGNYGAVSSAGALGKYQIMPANIPSWSQAALGYSITPQKFLHSPKLQEAIARAKLAEYFNQYGVRGAASAWFSGQPDKYQSSSQVNNYVLSILRRMGIL